MLRLIYIFVLLLLCHPLLAEDEFINIGVLASLTGNWAEIGENLRKGTELAAKEINESGGISGKKVRLHYEDTDEEKSGAKVVTAYRYFRSRGIKLLIGPTGVLEYWLLLPWLNLTT